MTECPVPRPVFIIGAPRSGTSILTWCLAQHPNILMVPETNWLAALASQLKHFFELGSVNRNYTHLSHYNISKDEFFASFGPAIDTLIKTAFERKYGPEREHLRQGGEPTRIRAWVRSANDPKNRWVDGAPVNSSYTAALTRIFPEAQFVHITRDPGAVLQSLCSHETLSDQFPDPHLAVQYIFHSRRAAHMAEAALGRHRVLRTDLDRLLADPDTELTRLLKHLGEVFDPNCRTPLEEKINDTPESLKLATKVAVKNTSAQLMKKLYTWQQQGEDPNWLPPIDPASAQVELETYAGIPVNSPPSGQQLGTDW